MTHARHFGQYELISRLGRGGMGEVWRAKHRLLNRHAAVKLIRTEALSTEDGAQVETLLRRFEREAQVTSTLQSPHTVEIYDFGITADGTFYYVMELLEGLDLQTFVNRYGPLPAERVIYVLMQVCDSLAEAHHHELIHRDLKPANVFLTRRGLRHDVVKVLDFGLVKSASGPAAQSPHLTMSGTIVGSPGFVSPEAIRGEAIDERVDLYALGCVAYWLLTGQLVFKADTIPELLADHLRRAPEPPSRKTELEIPQELENLVMACLEKEPGNRPASVPVLIPRLQACPLERPWSEQQAEAWWKTHRPYRSETMTEAGAGRAETGTPSQNLLEETRKDAPHGSTHRGFDWSEYRRSRIAEWSDPRYRLDSEFVQLTLLVDQGEETATGRWSAQAERHGDLGQLLDAIDDPALVVLGPPGSGKSTLLRRLEIDVSQRALRGEDDRLTFFIQLNQYKGPTPGEPPPGPEAWLRQRWSALHPTLPAFEAVLRQGRLVLLLDALNEMPTGSAADLRNAVLAWKTFLERLVTDHPGNRVVFSCRTLDYSAPLSTSTLRVPQVVIEPLTDEQVEQFLLQQNATQGKAMWSELRGTPQLELMRSPYFLTLLVEQAEASGNMPKGRAGLFTGFVRQSLRREIERDNPLFAPDSLLTERDVRRVTQWKWRSDWELPERGLLVPKLVDLAFGMQQQRADGEASQVRIDLDDALHLLSHERSEDIVRAGVALSILDEDTTQEEILFVHQLTQEYFAARRLATTPEPERLRTRWRTAEVRPPIVEVMASLGPGESLPALATTGWEETALLATAMAGDPDAFIRGLMGTQLDLAGRCAAQPEVRERLSAKLLEELRRALVARSRDPEADLRARIAAGLALGPLGDPRFERRAGPHGDYLLPPMVEIAGGTYPMGEDEVFEYMGVRKVSHMPRHEVSIEPFRIGRFPVTNAEWALFMKAGGYDDDRWWPTPAARRWRSGEGTADGPRAHVRFWLDFFRNAPEKVDEIWRSGPLREDEYERWKKWLPLTEAQLEAELAAFFPGGKLRQPCFWRDERYNNPAQPVTGVCWFEVLAYVNWLSTQTGAAYRLPTEAEWEAAARGRQGRLHAWGDAMDALRGNLAATRVRRPTPVGIFPQGDTPEGASDLTGNVNEWTSSLFGPGLDEAAEFGYPYRADDGREELSAGSDLRRVLRGGGYYSDGVLARPALRSGVPPDDRDFIEGGFRVAQSLSSSVS